MGWYSDQKARSDARVALKKENKARSAEVHAGSGAKLASCGMNNFKRFTLYEHTIKTPEGEFAMTPEVTASVDDQTGRKFASGKTLALGLLGGVSKKTGNLWLSIEGPDFYVSEPAQAGIVANQARKFAAKVNMRAKQIASEKDE
jgi:hypothetical protein